MIDMPKRPERETETSVLRSCLVAINRLPGVRAVRNNNGKSPCACKACTPKLCKSCRVRLTRPVTFGLGDGSPDIQGRMQIAVQHGVLPVVFWIEVKTEGGRTSRERAELQQAFRDEAATRGEMSAVVTSAIAAVHAVEQMRTEYLRRLNGVGGGE